MSLSICDPRYQRLVVRLHKLGPRAIGEFLLEAMPSADARVGLMDQLEDYSRGTPTMMAAAGGDRFPTTLSPLSCCNGADDELAVERKSKTGVGT